MSFVEVEFLFFLPLVFAAYWLGPRRRGWQNSVLLLAGYLFYASWHSKLLGLLVVGTAIDYVVSRYLDNEGTTATARHRRLALSLSLGFSLGALAFFKYENFFAAQANAALAALGIGASLEVLQLVLPLGISYYTLQRVGYMLDVYYGRRRPARSFLDFALFCAYFPQITAGPIARGDELLPQLSEPRYLTAPMLAAGSLEFLTGYAFNAWASAVIASGLVDPVFSNPAEYDAASHWLAVAGFALQVFGDFAGYSLMAIGVSRFFGILLPVNFRFPFLSTSLPEFWRRWHISLNRWLFDYIFTPLTTSRGWFRGRIEVALLATFLASGLWHGANWTYIIWGLLHGLGLVVHYRWDESYKALCRRDRSYVRIRRTRSYMLGAWALTIGFFVITLVPFRAPSAGAALDFFLQMFISQGDQSIGVRLEVLPAIGLLVGYHAMQLPLLNRIQRAFFSLPDALRGATYGAAVVALLILTPIGPGTFIYQQF